MELALALVIGCLLAVQASANLQLTKGLGTPYGAAAVQLVLAALVLLVAAAATGALGALRADVTWWHLLGGLASPLYITSGILLFPRLGALLSVALFVTGRCSRRWRSMCSGCSAWSVGRSRHGSRSAPRRCWPASPRSSRG